MEYNGPWLTDRWAYEQTNACEVDVRDTVVRPSKAGPSGGVKVGRGLVIAVVIVGIAVALLGKPSGTSRPVPEPAPTGLILRPMPVGPAPSGAERLELIVGWFQLRDFASISFDDVLVDVTIGGVKEPQVSLSKDPRWRCNDEAKECARIKDYRKVPPVLLVVTVRAPKGRGPIMLGCKVVVNGKTSLLGHDEAINTVRCSYT